MSLHQCTPPPFHPPFTHRPGAKIHLAGTRHVLQAFPSALRCFACRPFDLECVKHIAFPEFGPLSDWTVFIDSMRQVVHIEGRGARGFIRYRIFVSESGIYLKPLSGTIKLEVFDVVHEIQKGEAFPLVEAPCSLPQFPTPRLLLGCHKAPSWDRIGDTPNMIEVLPFWYQQSRLSDESSLESSETLYGAIVEAVRQKKTFDILPAFATYFRVGMEGFFVPKRSDDLFMGYPIPLLPDEMALTEIHLRLCTLLKSLFLQESGNVVTILPCLPKELMCGLLLRQSMATGHEVDIEWRKGNVRRLFFRANSDSLVTVNAQAATATLRCIGERCRKRVVRLGAEIEVQAGKQYLLDNFST